MLSVTEVVLTLLVLFLSYKWSREPRIKIPRVGPPTIVGYVWTALRFTFKPVKVIEEGRARFGGRPFILPSLSGSWILLSGDDIEFVRNSDDSVFSQPHAVAELLATRQTMSDEIFIGDLYHANVVRTDVTRALPAIVPDLVDESAFALQETLHIPDGSDSVTIPVFHTMTHLIARVSNRALVGPELCRNEEYTRAMVHFAEFVMIHAFLIRFCPIILRDTLYSIASRVFGGKKEPLSIVLPYLKKYLKDRESLVEKPTLISEFLIRAAPPEELADLTLLAMRMLNLNFGSIHTSSIFITHTLYDLALMPEEQLEEIRAEVHGALERFGGWTKDAIAGFTKLDSILKEEGRYHFILVGVLRRTIKEGRLPDGQIVPAGYTCIGDIQSIHRNPRTYPDPEVFDPFRFSKLHEQGMGSNVKHLFTGTGRDFLPFGGGRHVCPGRFFVAIELKIMLAHILLNYDFKFPDGITTRPENIYLEVTVAPNTGAKLIFKKRPQQCWS